MNIYYLTGYPPIGDPGGGGFANTSLIGAGRSLGHSIHIYSSEGEVPEDAPDLYWLSNMNGRFSMDFLRERIDGVSYIVQDDGYQNLCPQPTNEYRLCFQDKEDVRDTEIPARGDYLPPLDCWVSPHRSTYPDCSSICRVGMMKTLLYGAAASISVSPMHGRIWANIFPSIRGKQVIVEPQIDTDLFRPTYPIDYDRNGTYLYVGTISKGKGYRKCVKYVRAQGASLISVGDIHHTIGRRAVRGYKGSLPQEALVRLYSTSKYFIHLPEWPEPQGRAVTEALLCGCIVITNSKCGAISYPWLGRYCDIDTYYMHGWEDHFSMVRMSRHIREFRDKISGAPLKFWTDLYDMGVVE